MPIPVAARSKAWVCCRLPARTAGSNSTGDIKSVPPVSVVCCHVEVSATGRSLLQRSPIECGMSECDLQTSTTNSVLPTGAANPLKQPYLLQNIHKKLHCHFKN